MWRLTTWFCDAYASWQKGGIENANGRLRRWLPREIDLDTLIDDENEEIVVTANLTPTKKTRHKKAPLVAILANL